MMDALDRAEDQQALGKHAGESADDGMHISKALAKVPDPRVFLSWLTEDRRQFEINVHVHLSIRRYLRLLGQGMHGEDQVRTITGDLCAVLQGGTWVLVDDFPDIHWDSNVGAQARLGREAATGDMDEPMLVGVGEAADRGKRWESRGGLIWLQRLDDCHVLGIDEVEEPPTAVLRWLNNPPLPVVWVIKDRELVSLVHRGIGEKNELGHEVIKGASHIVDRVTEFDPPVIGERFGFEDGGERIIKHVVATDDGLIVRFAELPNLGTQSVQVVFGAVELEPDTTQAGRHGLPLKDDGEDREARERPADAEDTEGS
jgi:hypothetical protein